MRLKDIETATGREELVQKGYEVFCYDREYLREKSINEPMWLHFGAGNIFRAFPAAVLDTLISEGICDKGITVCESFDEELIPKAYTPYDNLSLTVTLCADGNIRKHVVGSVIEAVTLGTLAGEGGKRIKEIFASPSLSMVSFTITEKGYAITSQSGEYLPVVASDLMEAGLEPKHLMGKLAALLLYRYEAGAAPLAMVSMDNCSHNGDKLKTAVLAYAKAWEEKGLVTKEFYAYVSDGIKVTFPLSMIDKITPRPDKNVSGLLTQDDFTDTDIIITSKNTYTAPFVNAEETQYLVIEDLFPNGRPNLSEGGILFTDRNTVDMVEKMKVCTCLNPLHTALAIFGCLLGYTSIHEEMNNPALVHLIQKLGYTEGMPVVSDPHIISPKEFIDNVITKRLPNPFMPDTPQRIACDTSQKLPIRFGETLKAYRSKGLPVRELTYIPLVFAGYLRYLMQEDDKGSEMVQSPDPLLSELKECMKDVKLGDTTVSDDMLQSVLGRKDIFAVDLYEIGLADKIKVMFLQMIRGTGAVEETLREICSEH